MIKISYDNNAEMMEIHKGAELIFLGNYWDFDASPSGIEDFLANIGIECEIEEYKYED